MREIKNINFAITTACNRNCSNCSYNTKAKKSVFYDWDYIVHAARFFKGYNVNLTGGEPTTHPDFKEIVPKLKDLFKCETLSIETNGFGFDIYYDLFEYFDYIHFSYYLFGEDNSGSLKALIRKCPELVLDSKIVVHPISEHIPRSRRGSGKVCDRGNSSTVAYMDGVIYPCCIGDGVDGATGVTLSDNWVEELLKISPACKNCFFSP